MKISTKNLDETIKSLKKKRYYIRKTIDCNKCGKRINHGRWLAFINGFGFFNYYHPECRIKQL